MAQHQVTHDNETLEEKEKKIQDFLDEHGLTIPGAPKVHHQEANVIMDDVRYPIKFPIEQETEVNSGVTPSKYDGVALSTLEDIPEYEYTEAVIKLITPKLNKWISTYAGSIPASIAPQTGLCFEADELKSYDLVIARKTGLYKVTVIVGEEISILTYNGDIFRTYVGKITNFYLRTMSTAESKIRSELFIVLDTSPEPFDSHIDLISINQIVDIGEPGVNWDISEYGVDIKKKYYDWVEELRKGNYSEEKPVVVAPSGNLKIQHIPPLDLSVTTFEQAGLDESAIVMAKVKNRFTLTFMDGSAKLYDVGDVIDILMVSTGYAMMPTIEKDNVLYFIPVDYLSFWNLGE